MCVTKYESKWAVSGDSLIVSPQCPGFQALFIPCYSNSALRTELIIPTWIHLQCLCANESKAWAGLCNSLMRWSGCSRAALKAGLVISHWHGAWWNILCSSPSFCLCELPAVPWARHLQNEKRSWGVLGVVCHWAGAGSWKDKNIPWHCHLHMYIRHEPMGPSGDAAPWRRAVVSCHPPGTRESSCPSCTMKTQLLIWSEKSWNPALDQSFLA